MKTIIDTLEYADELRDYHQFNGKTVTNVRSGKDNNGYDVLEVHFTDGSAIRAHEQGQVGWFAVDVKEA